jgi:hypothetical protein
MGCHRRANSGFLFPRTKADSHRIRQNVTPGRKVSRVAYADSLSWKRTHKGMMRIWRNCGRQFLRRLFHGFCDLWRQRGGLLFLDLSMATCGMAILLWMRQQICLSFSMHALHMPTTSVSRTYNFRQLAQANQHAISQTNWPHGDLRATRLGNLMSQNT